jgi:aspartyl-tRNA(Asn)/glutamyl-tRNA(Gln) amidotransferase subunit A
MWTVVELAEGLAAGRVRARELIEQCLARINDATGQGPVTFLGVFTDAARAHADALDRERAAGVPLPPLAGVPVSVKDLFDIAGQVTAAGSVALLTRPPAAQDAEVVARLRAAGLVIVGRTNMTELAYSGLGINPHYGTPLNPFDRAAGRIPGGSSSGAAVSVTDRLAAVGIGTDTGGSCRIPAALSGVVGFKPTASRVPRAGVAPLSTTLDTVGPLAPTVSCCALLDAVMSGGEVRAPQEFPLRGLRLLLPSNYVTEDLDETVAAAFDRSLAALSGAGVLITRAPLRELDRLPQINAKGGFNAAESYATYGALLESQGAAFDPRVAIRILKGREQTAADYLELQRSRVELIQKVRATTATHDAVVMPTVPIIAPTLRSLAGDAEYFRANALVLRNTSIANFLDGCALSIPIHRVGEAPVGLTLMADTGADQKLLAIARAAEALLSPRPAD